MGVVVRKNKHGVKVYWNGSEEIVSVRSGKGVYEFVLKSGKVVRTENRHLFEVVRRRLENGR